MAMYLLHCSSQIDTLHQGAPELKLIEMCSFYVNFLKPSFVLIYSYAVISVTNFAVGL